MSDYSLLPFLDFNHKNQVGTLYLKPNYNLKGMSFLLIT